MKIVSKMTHSMLIGTLKMIGKGFVLFKINSSPSAFYIIKPTCIGLVIKVINYPLKIVEKFKPKRLVYVAD